MGRDHEVAHLDELLGAARHGSARSVVVRGEAGVGKTALLEELVARADGALVLRTVGLEAEAPLAFAALHRLLRPLTRLRDCLPAPQTRALQVAFGETDGPSVEPFLVAVATLSLLTAAAEETLVMCVVEDAHWLDPATAEALLFCARRVGADRVLMVFSVREGVPGAFRPDDLPELVLAGLDSESALALLDARAAVLDPAVSDRILAEAGGNPLALLELPAALSADQLAGQVRLPEQLPLTRRVEEVFLQRSKQLPTEVQSLLLLAAADDTGQVSVLRQAASHLGLGDEALQAALESGLLGSDTETVWVRHPLVRSAIYQAAADTSRRATHRALAQALAGAGESDRQAWHRAAAATGPDLDVAESLAEVGARAERRGGAAAAMAAYERAATLSTGRRRDELTLAAARNAWASGQIAACLDQLAAARERATDVLLLHDIARLHGHVEVNIGSAVDAHRIFIDAAHAVREHDAGRALETAVAAALLRSYSADSGATLPAHHVLTEPDPADTPRTRCLKPMLRAMTLTADGDWAGAVAALDEASAAGTELDDIAILGNMGNAALQLGDDSAQQRFYGLALSRARQRGSATGVLYSLQRLCFGHLMAGDLAAIRTSAQEAIELGQSMGQRGLTATPLAWMAFLAAVGDRDDYDDALAEAEQVAATHPLGILTDPVHDVTRWAKGARAASAGNTFEALHHASRCRLPVLARTAFVERIDTAVRAGEPDLARGWVHELTGFAQGTERPWALAALAYGRAMTTEDTDAAEALFKEALVHHRGADRPLEEARVHLSYGEWLRRSQRRVDSRQHLRHALETFRDTGTVTLINRAEQELRASGETARKRDVSTLVDLTPMERTVAQLVATGLSNMEVAAQIWVSPRTVAFHLRNVFAKAGVTSRTQLAGLDLG